MSSTVNRVYVICKRKNILGIGFIVLNSYLNIEVFIGIMKVNRFGMKWCSVLIEIFYKRHQTTWVAEFVLFAFVCFGFNLNPYSLIEKSKFPQSS